MGKVGNSHPSNIGSDLHSGIKTLQVKPGIRHLYIRVVEGSGNLTSFLQLSSMTPICSTATVEPLNSPALAMSSLTSPVKKRRLDFSISWRYRFNWSTDWAYGYDMMDYELTIIDPHLWVVFDLLTFASLGSFRYFTERHCISRQLHAMGCCCCHPKDLVPSSSQGKLFQIFQPPWGIKCLMITRGYIY